jgi:hypothetical protein
MKLYKYDSITKEYKGVRIAQKDPKNPDKFLMQVNSTTKKPPMLAKNQIAVFNDTYWKIESDYRKSKIWDIDTKQIVNKEKIRIGKLPNNYTDKKPINEEYGEWDGEKWIINEKKYNKAKYQKLRRIRDNLINNTIWVQQRHQGELKSIELGITTKKVTLTQSKFKEWLLYWEKLRDLPQNVDLTKYKIAEINRDNTNIFPIQPK